MDRDRHAKGRLGARSAWVGATLTIVAMGLQGCADEGGREGVALPPTARAEAELYAEIAHSLQGGLEPVADSAGEADAGTGGDAGAGDEGAGADTAGPADDGSPADSGDGGAGDAADGAGDGAGGSCFGACGQQVGDCWCDDACTANGDCCSDHASACPGASSDGGDAEGDGGAETGGGAGDEGAGDDGAGASCAGFCGDVSGDGCWCDAECATNGDCCADYFEVCGGAIVEGFAPGLSITPPTQDLSLSCVASWTGSSAVKFAATGVLVGEAISKTCEAGGVIVGLSTAGAGFAAATVCLAGDVSNADAALGALVFGIFGAVKGLIDGVQECSGEQLEQAEEALGLVLEKRGGTDRVFVAPVAAGQNAATGTCNPCPDPDEEQPEPDRVDCVPPSIPHGECTSHHVHVYAWKIEQNPSDCVCRYKADETYLCYEPGTPFANDPIWERCL
jgi:hypothetical protein